MQILKKSLFLLVATGVSAVSCLADITSATSTDAITVTAFNDFTNTNFLSFGSLEPTTVLSVTLTSSFGDRGSGSIDFTYSPPFDDPTDSADRLILRVTNESGLNVEPVSLDTNVYYYADAGTYTPGDNGFGDSSGKYQTQTVLEPFNIRTATGGVITGNGPSVITLAPGQEQDYYILWGYETPPGSFTVTLSAILTPEPSYYVLLGLGLLALLVIGRRDSVRSTCNRRTYAVWKRR